MPIPHEHLNAITHDIARLHEQITCLNESRSALAVLENYTEGLAGHFSGPIAHLHIELGKNELEIRRRIAALGDAVASTLQEAPARHRVPIQGLPAVRPAP